ncbi:FBP domain-containing protein [Actinoallomurus spadix]|nr:FBP domain-containing protein [Actinoallomurus spadix]MCO5987886.1 FBP domain-containing protein [Actinoallomurus spadix]
MKPIGENEIRASFINCSKGEARKLHLPRGLADLPWDDLDFLGWRDPGAPDRGYLVAERGDGLIGVSLRVSAEVRRSMVKTTVCSVCLTSHAGSGVSLFVARRAGAAGRDGNTVGTYICGDLACPLYVRGKKKNPLATRYTESLTLEEQVDRMRGNLNTFLDQVAEERLSA